VILMSTYKELEREFERKIKELQNHCDHKELSKWTPISWAPGHYTGHEVIICRRCGLIINERTQCYWCGQWIEKKNWIKDDNLMISKTAYFCSEKCLQKYRKKNRKEIEALRRSLESLITREM